MKISTFKLTIGGQPSTPMIFRQAVAEDYWSSEDFVGFLTVEDNTTSGRWLLLATITRNSEEEVIRALRSVADEHIRKFAKVVEIKLAWEVVPEEA